MLSTLLYCNISILLWQRDLKLLILGWAHSNFLSKEFHINACVEMGSEIKLFISLLISSIVHKTWGKWYLIVQESYEKTEHSKIKCFFTYSGFELTYCDLGNMIHFSFFMMQFFLSSLKIVMPKHIKLGKNFLVDFNHREKLYFTEFSRRICWNRSLVASSLFFLFTQSNKFDKFHWHILRKRWFIKLTE